MAGLNMANINTLFKKGYLLAGVIMAANIFVGNEMKAMDKEKKGETSLEDINNTISPIANIISKDITRPILYWENYFNFFGTLALSGFNNYFKWYDYDAGSYFKLGCLGWRFKRLLNDIFQFEGNFNLCRGISWGFLGFWFLFVQKCTSARVKKNLSSIVISSLFFLIINNENRQEQLIIVEMKNQDYIRCIAFFLLILQGFVSIPMTFHFSIFSISISLDAILWELVTIWARKKKEKLYGIEEKEMVKKILETTLPGSPPQTYHIIKKA